jgi:RES domain-containing protein
LYGGRWNSAGRPVLYTAESRSLALAEILVHLESAGVLPRYFLFQVEIDKSYIADVDPSALPKNWRAEPAPRRLQTLGDDWLFSGKLAVPRVPSAIVAFEFSYLLNPLHPDFAKLKILGSGKFPIDQLLVK